MLIDTHAHVYDEKFIEDLPNIIANCKQHNVGKILMPNCDSSTINVMHACAEKYPAVCIAMMGLHPCYVQENYVQELTLMEALLNKPNKYCAIGEIGLDYYWDKTFVPEQKKALHRQIEWALHYNLPIVIHSRESTADCIEIIKPYIAKGLKGVFHCFSGTLQEAKTLLACGFYLGIGGVLTYKKSGLQDLVKEISINNLILETDAPYLAPVPYRGKRNEPAYTAIIAQCLAETLELPFNVVEEATTLNAQKLFNLAI